ncbi:MAG TPA: tetratricopeptide repeat protein [Gammaproteobacteria bacterium]|nr:tetratricopeptide repeat protein [Gammaproteobacteria bacterium]
MDFNKTEEEQIEELKKWWAENGKFIVAGVVLGLGALFGWRGWQAHLIAQAEAASVLYSDMIAEVRQDKEDEVRTLAERLLKNYSKTSYATFASLMLAKLEVDNGNLDAAVKHLQRAVDQAELDEIKRLAQLRLARVQLDRGKPDAALALVKQSAGAEYQSSYDELRGDIYLQQGKRDEALAAYRSALATAPRTGEESSFLQLKIDDLDRQGQ